VLRQPLAALGDVPNLVLGRRVDVLAWNPAGRFTGLTSIDDFTFTSAGDILAALDGTSTVVRIGCDGRVTTFLDAADGVQNPTSAAVRGDTVYVLSAAFFGTDPNLVLATLPRS